MQIAPSFPPDDNAITKGARAIACAEPLTSCSRGTIFLVGRQHAADTCPSLTDAQKPHRYGQVVGLLAAGHAPSQPETRERLNTFQLRLTGEMGQTLEAIRSALQSGGSPTCWRP